MRIRTVGICMVAAVAAVVFSGTAGWLTHAPVARAAQDPPDEALLTPDERAGAICDPIAEFLIIFTNPNRYRGNLYTVDRPSRLKEFQIELDLSAPTELFFSIHQKRDQETEFTKIWPVVEGDGVITPVALGQNLYSSGPVELDVGNGLESLELVEGSEYAIAVAWATQEVAYGRDSRSYPQPYTRGKVLGGLARNNVEPPMADTLVLNEFTGGAYSMVVCFEPDPGACCLPNDECQDLPQAECDAQGGVFTADLLLCEDIGEPVCPLITEACCLPNNTCLDINPFTCEAQGGLVKRQTFCTDPPEELCGPFGACCVGDTVNPCLDHVTESRCGELGGTYRGDNTVCSELNPACVSGACCSGDFCLILPEDQCESAGGSFKGSSVLCDPGVCDPADPVGACCTDTGCVEQVTQVECETLLNGTYKDDESLCDFVICEEILSPCCFPGGIACGDFLPSVCVSEAIGGFPGVVGEECQMIDCTDTGACCTPRECREGETPESCAGEGGIYQGKNTLCVTAGGEDEVIVSCPAGPSGACCIPGSICLEVPLSSCLAIPATGEDDWKGAFTTCIDADGDGNFNDCPGTVVGECTTNEECQETDPEDDLCTVDLCIDNFCQHQTVFCLDDLFCDDVFEVCDIADGICKPGAPVSCPVEEPFCDEENDICLECLEDVDCNDGLFCTGRERCVRNVCVAGREPCLDTECDDDIDACKACAGNTCVVCQGDQCEVCVGAVCTPCEGDECELCEGDANADRSIDAADTGFVQARFGCNPAGADLTCAQADVNGDSAVDAADTGFIQARFGNPCLLVGSPCCFGDENFCAVGSTTACEAEGGVPAASCLECFECVVDLDCDDETTCTDDTCVDNACVHTAGCPEDQFCDEGLAVCVDCLDDATCDDGEFCNGAEICDAGVCGEGANPCEGIGCNEDLDVCAGCVLNIECNDDDPCTIDICNTQVSLCLNQPILCSDNVFCNGLEFCDNGSCVIGGDPCPDQRCDDDIDVCFDCNDDIECNDGVNCTTDTCVDRLCQLEVCPGEFCEENSDVCVECLVDVDCDDGLACTGTETCVDNVCEAGTFPCPAGKICDEAEPFTCRDCVNDAECNDGALCNGLEICDAGTCAPDPAPEPCPGQLCDSATNACVDCLIDGDCHDGVFCDGVETCVDNVCQAGDPACPENFPFCEEENDLCLECQQDSDCDDGLACTGDEVCVDNFCESPEPLCPNQVCDEGSVACSPCTSSAQCDDGNFCNGVEFCFEGSCERGAPACQGQVCDKLNEVCVECRQDVDCEDGLACTGLDTCVNTVCVSEGNPCPPPPAGTDVCTEADLFDCGPCTTDAECDDGIFCNGKDICLAVGAGACFTVQRCAAGQVCDEEQDSCGICQNDAECDDGVFCNGVETCDVDNTNLCQDAPDPCTAEQTCDENAGVCKTTP